MTIPRTNKELTQKKQIRARALEPSIFQRWAEFDKRARAGWFAERFDPSLDQAAEFRSLYRGEAYTDEDGRQGVAIHAANGVQIKNGTLREIADRWRAWATDEENDTQETTVYEWLEILMDYRAHVLRVESANE